MDCVRLYWCLTTGPLLSQRQSRTEAPHCVRLSMKWVCQKSISQQCLFSSSCVENLTCRGGPTTSPTRTTALTVWGYWCLTTVLLASETKVCTTLCGTEAVKSTKNVLTVWGCCWTTTVPQTIKNRGITLCGTLKEVLKSTIWTVWGSS